MANPFINPTIDDFKSYFVRDFPFGTDIETSVLDADIGKSFGQTNFTINPNLFPKQEDYTLGYMWLAAHWLVVDLRAASQGIAGRYNWVEASKSVGNVSSSYSIPQKILDNPSLAMFTQTRYGGKYLEMILPQLTGYIFTVHGHTHP